MAWTDVHNEQEDWGLVLQPQQHPQQPLSTRGIRHQGSQWDLVGQRQLQTLLQLGSMILFADTSFEPNVATLQPTTSFQVPLAAKPPC